MSRVAGVQEAYDTSAAAWVRGPEAVYEVLADALVTTAGVPMSGTRVVDLGAGTGTASRAARRAGARLVVGVDVSRAMLEAGRGWDVAVVCDASTLPFLPASFDVAVAAFSIGHLDDPAAGIAEARRVARSLVASAFRMGWTHPAKTLVDDVAARFGFVSPDWYGCIKSGSEAAVDDPDRLVAMASAAGYGEVHVAVHDVDVGLRTPEQITAWRLGMAHLAPFVASLDPERRRDLVGGCVRVLDDAPPVIVPMAVLAAVA